MFRQVQVSKRAPVTLSDIPRRLSLTMALLAPVLMLGLGHAAEQKTSTKPVRLKFAEYSAIASAQLARLPNYKPGTVLTRADVEPIFPLLTKAGWSVSDRGDILQQLHEAGDPLVTELRSSAGQGFAQQIAKYPEGYDRLDHLLRLPRGKQTVHDLVRSPDGYKLVKYMTETNGGAELGKMLSKDPHGADFNASTGRIYTEEQLFARLKASYDADHAAGR